MSTAWPTNEMTEKGESGKKTKTVDKEIGGKISDTAAALFTLGVGLVLWWVGAFLTLQALVSFGIPVNRLGLGAWIIPIGVSAIEMRWWPKPKTFLSYRTLMLGGVALADVASTFFGAWAYLKGCIIPLFTGITLPSQGQGLMAVCGAVSILVTFAPERLIVHAVRDILHIWGIKQFLFITAEA